MRTTKLHTDSTIQASAAVRTDGIRNQVGVVTVSLTAGQTFTLDVEGALGPNGPWYLIERMGTGFTTQLLGGTLDSGYSEFPLMPYTRTNLTAVQAGTTDFEVSLRE